MDPDRLERIQALFEAALDCPPPDRRGFLEAACGEDADLLEEVVSLLQADRSADAAMAWLRDGLAELAGDALADGAAGPRWEGRRVGPYRVIRRIGEGGMGTVYLAERDDVDRQVALKMVRGPVPAPALIRRFLLERRVLARLTHPGIAGLLDVGTAPDGTPWLAMELVDGERITDYADRRRLDVPERLRLFLQVCDAVAYAHVRLVVHRDIKPSNVLVGRDGRPRLLDFGIAKLLDSDDAAPDATRTGFRVLSPEHAAPEQVTGDPVTTATDVHALGVLLFELLTGERPYSAAGRAGLAAAAAVLSAEPPRPSTIARRSGRALRAARALSGDLDAICLRAIAKQPDRRYPAAQQLADDVRRHLRGLPVEARLPTLRYRAGKFLRRHAAAVAASVLLLISLSGGLAATFWQGQRARAALGQSEAVAAFLVELFEASDPESTLGEDVPVRTLLEQGVRRVEQLRDQPLVQARMMDAMARAYLGLGNAPRAQELAGRSVELRTLGLGREHPDVAASLSTLAEALDRGGREEAAKERHREALEIRRRTLGDSDPATTGSMLRLARLLVFQGEREEAAALAESALERRRANGRSTPEELAEALEGLAVVRWLGPQDLDAAEALYREALGIREQAFGPDDPRVEATLVPLGSLLSQQHRHEEAESVARRALALRERIYGPDNTAVAYQLGNVAYVLERAGRHEEAASLYREMERRYRHAFDGDHPRIASALHGIAGTFYPRGMLDSVATYLEPAVAMVTRLHGPEHPETALARHNFGMLQLTRGHVDAAVEELGAAYRLRARLHGEDSPGALRSGAAYASALTEAGRHVQAEDLLREIVRHQRSAHPSGHPDLARTLMRLGDNLQRQQRLAEAESHLRASVEMYRASVTPDHHHRARAVELLASLYDRRGRPDEARRIRAAEVRP